MIDEDEICTMGDDTIDGDAMTSGAPSGTGVIGTPGDVRFVLADYADPAHARDLVALLDGYARDPMGGGEPLADVVREHLAATLAAMPNAFSILGYASDGQARDRARAVPVALANCFVTLSTFACRPLVNVHDLAVVGARRGQGIGRALLEAVADEARARGACKLTLEVLEGNALARRAYARAGFRPYRLDETTGTALFLQKTLG